MGLGPHAPRYSVRVRYRYIQQYWCEKSGQEYGSFEYVLLVFIYMYVRTLRIYVLV